MSNSNYEALIKLIGVAINTAHNVNPPTESELEFEAERFRSAMMAIYPITDIEFKKMVQELKASMVVIMDDGVYISDPNSSHQSWLPSMRAEIDFYYWNRYKKYLEEEQGWNSGVTAKLDKVTDEILDLCGNPKSEQKSYQRRGLVLGDVQSGKTANYTGICNKAADCGYKVIIVLAGMMENLRIQTQERLDAEFAGRKSKYQLDPTANQEIKNTPFGVGRIPPVDINKRIACFTSVNTDFNQVILKSNDLTLRNINGTAIFVVKKNKKVLNNLHSWLLSNNADLSNMIDLPLLLIDDEADNASVNTKKDDEDPTAINAAIRNILHSFSRASYVGITATPFANIFINPDVEEGEVDDLFPKDFIYALSPPSNYIGADAIFGSLEDTDSGPQRIPKYGNAVHSISNEEMADFFPFKHKKDIPVDELPPSMYEALGYFMLVNAIRDLRGDRTNHRSMLINVTRYTDTQVKIADLINEWIIKVRSDLGNYSKLSEERTNQIKNIRFLKNIWEKHNLEYKAEINWNTLLKEYLYKAVAPIEVRAVNQKTGSASLDYFNHKEQGFRVIAVGGNSLSRGLTLEGLCVSYFYRNSIMYDTLLQMGRWFGYRKNYEDIFTIWMASEAVKWYGSINEATNELKLEIAKMRAQNQTPAEFGLKVRQDPNSLIVTARNKMRTGTLVKRPITVSGKLLETPRLKLSESILSDNENKFRMFVANLDSIGKRETIKQNGYFWRGIPKDLVANLVRNFDSHPWHLAFQPIALSDYISGDNEMNEWDVVMPQGSSKNLVTFEGAYEKFEVSPSERTVIVNDKMILISGTKVRVGSGGATKFGLSDDDIERAKIDFQKIRPGKTPSDSAYLIKGRKPLLFLHVVEAKPEEGQSLPPSCPPYLFALGLGFPDNGKTIKTANYVVNIKELRNWIDINEDLEEDDDVIR